jgi:peroxiredoxin Q/BCP
MLASDFSLNDQYGDTHTLSQYKGSWVILYFYPKDDTPGCTIEACSFRDNLSELKKRGVTVLGISKDTVGSHKKFVSKYELNFPLLADPDKAVHIAYDVLAPKKFMGKSYMGVVRTTFLINQSGEIVKKYQDMELTTHVADILHDIDTLSA